MLFQWKMKREYQARTSPQELYAAIIANLADSALEVRASEITANSFRVKAALKSNRVYLHSLSGRYTSIGSTFVEITGTKNEVKIVAQNPIIVVFYQLMVLAWCVHAGYAMITINHRWLLLLFPISILFAFCAYARALSLKCYKEAIRVVDLES